MSHGSDEWYRLVSLLVRVGVATDPSLRSEIRSRHRLVVSERPLRSRCETCRSRFLVASFELSDEVKARVSEHDRRFLFEHWTQPKATRCADDRVQNCEVIILKDAREALLISTLEMAKRLEMCPNSYIKFERRAAKGLVTIDKPKAAAEVMDCECIVVIKPKHEMSFANRIWIPLLNEAVANKRAHDLSRWNARFVLARRIGELLFEPKFRQAQRW